MKNVKSLAASLFHPSNMIEKKFTVTYVIQRVFSVILWKSQFLIFLLIRRNNLLDEKDKYNKFSYSILFHLTGEDCIN